jgi:UDP-N-acetylmuramoyl-tripeptide--D-alanyl-D-alanine ligase
VLAAHAHEFTSASIDSRTLSPGALFFALRAERDGHAFLSAAVRAGATGVVLERAEEAPAGVTAIAVKDTRAALSRFGHFLRKKHQPRVVAVTGSSGKTTTKELIAAALGDATLKTEGNLNNDLGVPLTLLRLGPSHRFAVIEMGMSAPGEIAALAALAEPEVGVVTMIGPAHLASMGSIENIARAKGELFHGLAPDGVAIFPADDARLAAEAGAASRRLTFGESERADVRLLEVKARGGEGSDVTLSLSGARIQFSLALPGAHNARNAAAAAAAAHVLGRSAADIAAGLALARAPKHRSELVEVAGRHVLADLYNANPASMAAALDTIASLREAHAAIAILGDMLELGEDAKRYHREIGEHAARLGLQGLVGVGLLGREIVAGARAAGMNPEYLFHTNEKYAAAVRATQWLKRGDFVLIKGSRGMRMEEVLEALQEELV